MLIIIIHSQVFDIGFVVFFFCFQRALSFEIIELDVKIVRETKQRYDICVYIRVV